MFSKDLGNAGYWYFPFNFNSFLHNPDVLLPYKKKAFENIVGKGEILVTSIFNFSHNVFYLFHNKLLFWVALILSSAHAFNLVGSKILSFGKE